MTQFLANYQLNKQLKKNYYLLIMKKDNTYNGWTNYETWRVNLELFNGDDEAWRHGSSDGMREFAELLIEESTDEGIGRDYAMAFLQNVDWQEIAEHYQQDDQEDVA